MIPNYCISSLKTLRDLPCLNIAQFTLNYRLFPSKRKTVQLLKDLSPFHDTDIIIHYDYIYIASRFKYFASFVQTAILDEIVSIMKYAQSNPHIIGIVMHTDSSFQRQLLCASDDKICSAYSKDIWNIDAVLEGIKSPSFVIDSIEYFCNQLYHYWYSFNSSNPGCNLYLENTTKVSPNNEGTVDSILSFLSDSPYSNFIGLCWDTEHDYAVTGRFLSKDDINTVLSYRIPLLVHLNTIPKEVHPFSKKDRHSTTTISECSLYNKEYYEQLSDYMCGLKIPFVREVTESTMYREMNYEGS